MYTKNLEKIHLLSKYMFVLLLSFSFIKYINISINSKLFWIDMNFQSPLDQMTMSLKIGQTTMNIIL